MRVLVGIDEHADADQLLARLLPLIPGADTHVILLNVVNPLIDGADIVAATRSEAVQQVVSARRRHLADVAAAAGLSNPTLVVEELAHGEDVAICIQRVCGREAIDLLVVASRRTGTIAGALLGSVADLLLRSSHCPVLVIRPGLRPS